MASAARHRFGFLSPIAFEESADRLNEMQSAVVPDSVRTLPEHSKDCPLLPGFVIVAAKSLSTCFGKLFGVVMIKDGNYE